MPKSNIISCVAMSLVHYDVHPILCINEMNQVQAQTWKHLEAQFLYEVSLKFE